MNLWNFGLYIWEVGEWVFVYKFVEFRQQKMSNMQLRRFVQAHAPRGSCVFESTTKNVCRLH